MSQETQEGRQSSDNPGLQRLKSFQLPVGPELTQHETGSLIPKNEKQLSFCLCSKPCWISRRLKPQSQHPARHPGPEARRRLSGPVPNSTHVADHSHKPQPTAAHRSPPQATSPSPPQATQPLSARAHYSEQMKTLTFQYSNNWLK